MNRSHEIVFEEPDHIHTHRIEAELGKEFFPFSKATEVTPRGKNRYGDYRDSFHGCQIRLNLPGQNGNHFPIRFLAHIGCSEGNGLGIVPFRPQLGYTITREDFDLETRRQKLLESIAKYDGFGIDSEAPMHLDVDLQTRDLIRAGIASGLDLNRVSYSYWNSPHHLRYAQGMQGLLRRIRLQVSANGSYETKVFSAPDKPYPTQYIDEFYPLDTGPLPGNDGATFSMEDDGSDLMVGTGHPLYFKDEDAEIFSIGMKFVLAPPPIPKAKH